MLIRVAGAMLGAGQLRAVLLTHLHSDHIVASLGPDISYRLARHEDLDYHSSPEEAALTAERAGMDTLVLTHYVPAFPPDGGEDWRERAAAHFGGTIEVGDDLHRVEVGAPPA